MVEKPTRPMWFIDVHVIDGPDAVELRELGKQGRAKLMVTDIAHSEISGAQDPETHTRLAVQIRAFDESAGPFILNHSLLGHGALADPEDGRYLRRVFATLWPDHDYDDDGRGTSRTGLTRFRDAMHVATAIRNNATGFVTNDDHVLKRADAIAAAFHGFPILSVAKATARSRAGAS